MSDKPSDSRKSSKKAPPQIVKFFSKPQPPYDESSSSSAFDTNNRKRKLIPNNDSSQPEYDDSESYAHKLRKNAEKISKIKTTVKADTLVSAFFKKENNDGLSDFESPSKRIAVKTPPVIKKKKVSRKRKQPDIRKAIKNTNAMETEVFEKILLHHSNANGMNSDELQMALALSRSLQDTHGSVGDSNHLANIIRNAECSQKEDVVRNTIQMFGFKKRDNNDYDFKDFFTVPSTKRKWISKFTALTRRRDNVQREKFSKKVRNILQICESYEKLDGESNPPYSVTSSYLQLFFIPESRLYSTCSALIETKIENFYTNDLVPISTVRCGSMLKNWADIPGRDNSPQRENVANDSSKLLEIKQCETVNTIDTELHVVVEVTDKNVSANANNATSDSELHNIVNVTDVNATGGTSYTELQHIDNLKDENVCDTVNVINSKIERKRLCQSSPDNFSDENVTGYTRDTQLDNIVDLTDENVTGDTSVTELDDNVINSEIEINTLCQNSPDNFSDENVTGYTRDTQLDNIVDLTDENVTGDTSDTELDDNVINSEIGKKSLCQSPDMFAGCESSANNSLEDGTSVMNVSNDKSDENKYMEIVGKLVHSEPIKVQQSYLSSSSDDLECGLTVTQNRIRSYENLISDESKAKIDEEFSRETEFISHKVNDVIVLSSDDSNQGGLKLSEVRNEPTQQDQPSKNISNSTSAQTNHSLSNTRMRMIVKHLSFTERLELYNNDPSLSNDLDDPINYSQLLQPSQDSIIISDDEINYSMNCNEEKETVQESISDEELKNEHKVQSHESIELSDSDDDDNPVTTQLSDNEIFEERESFISIDCDNDDEQLNSNHSMNDENLVNLSVKEICQKEFLSRTTKLSSTKNFLRTTSDMSFDRHSMKNTHKSTNDSLALSDDECDEFDLLVKGRRCLSNTQLKEDDVSDKSIVPQSPPQSNEFMVQSMDQIYQVRTGVLVTPKPDYENMDSPTRLEHLKKYGLKSLTKRKAVICLEHIYNRLHPFIELNGSDDVNNVLSQKTLVLSDNKTVTNNNSWQPNEELSNKSTESLINDYSSDVVTNIAEENFDFLRHNIDLLFLPSAPRAKKPWCLQPLHIAWHNLITSNQALYDQILQYEPVNLMEIRSMFKSIDLRYETNDIMAFFDRKCITFKTDNVRNKAAKKNDP